MTLTFDTHVTLITHLVAFIYQLEIQNIGSFHFFPYTKTQVTLSDLGIKEVKVNQGIKFENKNTMMGPGPQCCIPSSMANGPLILEKKNQNFFQSWQPSWSCDPTHLNKLPFPFMEFSFKMTKQFLRDST